MKTVKALVASLTASAFFLSGCGYCLNPAHQNEARCKVQSIVSQCGSAVIQSLVSQILPQVVAALVSDNFSTLLSQLVATLEHEGVSDALSAVTCAVAQSNLNLPAEMSPAAKTIKAHSDAWIAAHPFK